MGTALLAGGCGDDKATATLPTLTPASGLAVVNSDFKGSTSISLLDPTTRALVRDDCINSGTTSATLSQTLSGDVTLPSQPQPGNELALIDRGNSAITWLDPMTCLVKRQLSVKTGFESNPKDLVAISASKAYVPRYETNTAPGAQPNDGGDDLLIIDPTAATILGRIEMAPHAAPVEGKTIFARPDRALLADNKVFVTLNSMDEKFAASGEGRLVVVDPATDQVTGVLPLTGMKGCSAMEYVAASKTLMVVCGGFFLDADQGAASGVVVVDVATPPAVKTTLPASAVSGGQPLNFSSIVAISSSVVLVGAIGRFADATNNVEGVPDALLQLDPSTGTVTKLMDAGAFELGRGAGSSAMAMIPQGSTKQPRVQVFTVSAAGSVTKSGDLDPNPAHGLPPREIAWY
jgi:hypothetical protein